MLHGLGCLVFSLMFASVAAAECTDYEISVFSMTEEAKSFQRSQGFRDLGWSSAGPTNGWLDRMYVHKGGENLRNNSEFSIKYGFSIGDVYQIADEYRTEGKLDSFFQEIENVINAVEPCR
ncbi:hypothetical protein [Roseibium album]|uniref:hypothetical protein n=1 Tax=Roseibium album TaxID=311410 RepID=UPI00249365D0|nr:hypothetical protein [Roseibium album]